ncbi:MAG: GNAT family N-acetyltransferase [Halobacteriales archaeon]
MTGRRYPDDPEGLFPEPPRTVEDREDRDIDLQGYEPGSDIPAALVTMYEDFDPSDRAQGIPPSGEPRIRDWLDELFGSGYNVVAWHDETAAGHATLVPDEQDDEFVGAGDPDDRDPPQYELAIFVLQSYQQAGIGTALLETLLGFGATHGVERVWLTVEQWNRPAINLYEAIGFETVDARSFEREMGIRVETPGERTPE